MSPKFEALRKRLDEEVEFLVAHPDALRTVLVLQCSNYHEHAEELLHT